MKKTMSVFCLHACLLETGCASIVRGPNDRVLINSLEQDAVIYVDGAPRGKGSTAVDVKRGQPHDLIAKKTGCQDVGTMTTESFDAVTLWGIFWDFGLITVTIDLISGNAWKQDPAAYTITPICPTQATTPAMVTQ